MMYCNDSSAGKESSCNAGDLGSGPMDCGPPGFSIHGIFQARVLDWLPWPSPGDLPDPGIEPRSPALQEDALTSEPPGKPVGREDSGLLCRPGRKRRPSSSDDGGVSWVSSGCGAHGSFLTRHDEDLREPLVRCQGTHVSMRMARGSWSSLSSHGKRLGPQEALKKDSRGLSRVAAGNPRFPRLLQGTLGNFPGCL